MQKTPGKTPVAREKYWTKIVQEARKYPKGITEYCRVMNISKNNYYFWFKRLRSKHPEWHDLSNHPESHVLARKEIVEENTENEVPSSEVPVRAHRRKWSGADKKRILMETDVLSAGDLSAYLRREGIYVHTLNKWRTQRDLLNIANSGKNSRNDKSSTAGSSEIKKLKEENARLQKKLQQASDIIQLQKKISEMLSMAVEPNGEQ